MPSGARSAAPGQPLDARAAGGPVAVDALAPAGLAARRLGRQRLFEPPRWTALCVAVDLLMMVLGNVAALVGAPAAHADVAQAELIWILPPLVVAILAARGTYRDRLDPPVIDSIARVAAATSLAAISVIAAAAVIDAGADPAPVISRAWLFGTAYVAGGHILLAWVHRRARETRLVSKPTLIVGAGQVGARVEKRLAAQPELGLEPIGYLDSDPPPPDMVPQRQVPVLGTPADISRIAAATGARHVVLGFSSAPDHGLVPFVRECEASGLEVSMVPRLFESINVHVALDHVGGLPLLGLRSVNPKGWQFAIKHTFDRLVAALLIVVLLPVLVACAVAVKLSSRGPVFFKQRRIGRDAREFEMLKFRTMQGTPEEDGEADAAWAARVTGASTAAAALGASIEDRRTRVGSLLRPYSLDELPQLVNVLRGEMSLVGPRPERPEFVRTFEREVGGYADRLRVKSGLTGWAQVHGLRGQTSLSDRVEWDNWYIKNWSLGLDFKILLMTLAASFRRGE
jgi:exopolysaccharide biosynthesis polyprenyl glycosylphosphotransferase